ncbi:MAG TPA: hypothetical protein VHU16_08345 [Candidatus Udaeobacter sp.]|nr:hypothetical protein [Candidatus Udaeobacter sp.]
MQKEQFITGALFSVAMWVALLLLPSRVWACACCAHTGEYHLDFEKPDAYKLGVMERMRFGTTAYLFTGEAEPDDAAKGLAHPAHTYSLSGSLVGNVWKLTFRNGDESGALNLPLPAETSKYAADIHDRRTIGGDSRKPLLYKEWHFEGEVNGTGFFKAGIVAPAKYFLVLQAGATAATPPRILPIGVENHRQQGRLRFLR